MKKLIGLIFIVICLLFTHNGYAANPSVASWSIANGSTGVVETSDITVTFNSNPTLNSSTINGTNIYMKTGSSCSSGTSVAVSLTPTLGNPTSTVLIHPSATLSSGQQYVVCARRNTGTPAGIRNTSNENLTASSQTAFTVRDYLAPSISVWSPNPPSGVQSNANPAIEVTFSELMTQASIDTASVLLVNVTDGNIPVALNAPTFSTLTSPSRTKASFTLPVALTSLKTYQVTVKNTITDSAGNPMASDFSWSFSIDNTAPTVVSYTPSSAETPVYVNTATPTVSAVFTEIINNPTTSNFYLKQGSTTIATTPSFDSGTRTASLSLSSALTNGNTYTATLVGGTGATVIQDPLGNKLAANVTWSFVVDTTAPSISSVTPVNGTTSVPVGSNITVVFTENKEIRESTINATNVVVSDGTSEIPCTLSYVASTKTLTITPPGGAFNYNTTYTVSIGSIADKAGNVITDYSWSFSTQSVSSVVYTQVPPFIQSSLPPNVLIILDNSNSMDEDMNVNAIGSPFCTNSADPNTCSKSIIARKSLTNIINTYANNMRIGLMSYRLGGASSYYLHNTFYFSSYDPATYCPNPPAECSDYCINEGATARDACNTGCQAQNSLFDATVRDEIIDSSKANSSAVGSARRATYCSLIYPKYQRVVNPSDTAGFVYYGLPGTFYNSSNAGTKYLYAEGYNPSSGGDSYKHYNTKIGTSNLNIGYSNYTNTSSYAPTDSDIALGFDDFGRRMYWYFTSRTWFRNDSPGPGYLHVQAAINDPVNDTQKNLLLTKLGGNRTPLAYENDETGYMTCESGSVNTCAHIINAGLTPTAGTLQSAIDYYKGTAIASQGTFTSPIQNTCQRNFVIYVTDGLPSVNETGTSGNADSLIPAVVTKLKNLRCPDAGATTDNCKVFKSFSGTNVNFDVQTFVLGMGLNSAAKAKLDQMAVAGGTDVSGHAYYADNQTQLNNALLAIFQNILTQMSSGTAASILNNSEGSGASLMQAVFYPKKTFSSGSECKWVGEMQNLWYFLDPFLTRTSIREDTVQDNKLNLMDDKVVNFYFDGNNTKVAIFTDTDGDGDADGTADTARTNPDDVKSLWRAGRLLWERNLTDDPRTIYTGFSSSANNTPSKFSILSTDGFNTSSSGAWDMMQIPAGTDTARTAKATTLINYIHGFDQPNDSDGTTYRNRKVTISSCGISDSLGCTREWKLGDIVSATPRLISNVKLNTYDLPYPTGYNDSTYSQFAQTTTYQTRGMVLVSANDGMLHAFKLGVLRELSLIYDKAQINDAAGNLADAADKLGREEWAYIPSQVLPYLKYITESNYSHLFYVDKTPLIFDASIGTTAGCTDYSTCTKSKDTWRTILIGGMGLGGASRTSSSTCSIIDDCVKTPSEGKGFSSYFALDVTDPANPKYLWEFPGNTGVAGSTGFATAGPAIVRIAKRDTSNIPDHTKNGSWFVVFASGPTGPICQINHVFKGQSDQNLKLFIVDLSSGSLIRTIDTGIANAFAGNLTTSVIDTDRAKSSDAGWYSDDAVYIGYTKKDSTAGTWTKGGVVRLLTRESDVPSSADTTKQWVASRLIDDVGPVTTSIAKLQDRTNGNLWIYFGTGRYYFKSDDPSSSSQQQIFGIKEPCYSTFNRTMQTIVPGGTSNDIDQSCSDMSSTSITSTCVTGSSSICNQSGNTSTSPELTIPSSMAGWVINLDQLSGTLLSERVITDPVASSSGAVFFTTFQPNSDDCSFGGNSYIWAAKYDTGGVPPGAAMQGKALLQVSTGAFAEISLATAFSGSGSNRYEGRRITNAITGVPPTGQGLSVISNPPPVKKMMHIREK